MSHDDDTCPHLVRANLLEAENARLKAEVENLLPKDYYDPLLYHCGECQRMSAYLAFATSKYIRADTEIARLKAEVERLTSFTTRTIVPNEELQAQVERLTKAGDMCDQLLACFEMEGRRGVNIGRDMWREAKGGQP